MALPTELPEAVRHKREPFEYNAGARIGLLCVHGFSGSPHEMRPLGEFFAQRGWHVRGIVLPRHGGYPDRLKGAKWQEWPAATRVALDDMAARCEHVFLAGLSMGGLITLRLAAEESGQAGSKLRGIAVMATPAGLFDPRSRYVKYARFVIPWFYPLRFADLGDPRIRARMMRNMRGVPVDLDDPKAVAHFKRALRIPTSAISELITFNDIVLRQLPQVRVPAFVAQGTLDRTVAARSADVIGAALGSQRKHVGWYEGFDHEMPQEDDAARLFGDIAQFFDECI
jgi:carboxylesterase